MDHEHQLSEEEELLVTEGEAAASLLDSAVFIRAIEKIRGQCAEGILTSEPSSPDVREHLYNLSRGLSAVTEQLVIMASTAQSIVGNAELQTQANEDVQAEPDDLEGD